MAKSVKVHDDTHRALKLLKAKKRSKSVDAVIRQMIRDSTGAGIEGEEDEGDTKLMSYLKG